MGCSSNNALSKDAKYWMVEGAIGSYCKYLNSKLFQLQLRNCGPKTPEKIIKSHERQIAVSDICSISDFGLMRERY